MTTLSVAADTDGIDAPRRRAWAIAAVLAAMAAVVLDAAVVTIALPTLAQALQVPAASAVRIVTAYQLGLVAALFPAAALGEALGLRRVFVAGTALFTGAAALCALSPSLEWLVAARVVQGIGGAGIMALGVALLRMTVPTGRLGAAIGWNAMAVALSSAAGPTLGAAILAVAPWPLLFALGLPIGALALAASLALPGATGTGRRPDAIAIALNAGSFGLLGVGVTQLPSSPAIGCALAAGAAICATVLVRRDAGRPAPLLPLDLLARPVFRVAALASILCFGGQTAGMVALPFLLQDGFGATPLATGLALAPWPLTVALTGPLAGWLAGRVSSTRLCLAGGMILAVGLGAAATLAHQPVLMAPCMILCGAGFALFNVSNNRVLFLSAPRARSGAAGGLQGVARLTGQTLGALAMTLLFALAPSTAAPRIGLALGAALTLAAALASLLRARADQGA